MEVRPAYKHTDIGLIPQEWRVAELQQIGNLSKGRGLLKEDIQTSGSVPAIPYTALYTDFSEVVDYGLIKWFVDDIAGTIVVNEPCLLIASSSNIAANTGKASAIPGINPVAIGREVIIFRTDHSAVFFSYLLSTAPYRKRTLVLARGTTIKHLYPATFANYRVAVPSSTEQLAITKALDDVTALLSGLERLIAKKRDIKQAVMQQLLTGQTRLPGFSGEWASSQLGDLLNVCHGKNQHEVEVPDGPYPILATGGQIGTARQPLHDRPSVLIGRKGTINKPQYMDTPFWTVDTLFYCDVRQPNSAKFLYYRFLLIDWMQYNEASGVPSLNGRTIEHVEIECPDSKEQTAIATVLSEMDADFSALESRLAKIRVIKQGMMQELLTGKTRLI